MWIKIKDFMTKPEAQVAKSFLESQGLLCRLSVDDAGGLEPQLATIEGVSLFVDEEDAAEATQLLETPA